MAPYVMGVEINNMTDFELKYLGHSRLSDLDGETKADGQNVPPGVGMTIDITKSGGVDGLFSTLSWALAQHNCQFSVYCEMPASGGGGDDIFMGLRNYSSSTIPHNLTDSIYDYGQGKRYKTWPNPIVTVDGITVTLQPVRQEYPQSVVRVTVLQPNSSSIVGPKMAAIEGKRFRSPDGRVWLVLEGKLRHIQDMGSCTSMFGSNAIFESLGLGESDGMPKGLGLIANPSLIQSSAGGKVYFVDDAKKRWIRDPAVFARYGFDWGQVVKSDDDIRRYPDGDDIK